VIDLSPLIRDEHARHGYAWDGLCTESPTLTITHLFRLLGLILRA
jgi:hypothetical protein